MTEQNTVRQRRTFTAEEKATAILRIIQDGEKLSAVADDLKVQPNQLIDWKKQFFANAAVTFVRADDRELARANREISRLEGKIAEIEQKKDQIISLVTTEMCELKKKLLVQPSKKGNGSSPM